MKINLQKNFENNQADLRRILEFVCKKRFEEVVLNNFILTTQEEALLEQVLHEHINQHKPLEYIIGKVNFLDLELDIYPPILIPRPETEELVSNVIKIFQDLREKHLHIVDVGTGSGCIAIALALEFPQFHVTGVDISETALELASANAKKYCLPNISFIKSDLLSNINKPIDMVISNPPYISVNEYNHLDKSVKDWEDINALVGGQQGTEIIEELVRQTETKLTTSFYLTKYPRIIIEIGHTQSESMINNSAFNYFKIETNIDAWGKDRYLYFYKK